MNSQCVETKLKYFFDLTSIYEILFAAKQYFVFLTELSLKLKFKKKHIRVEKSFFYSEATKYNFAARYVTRNLHLSLPL